MSNGRVKRVRTGSYEISIDPKIGVDATNRQVYEYDAKYFWNAFQCPTHEEEVAQEPFASVPPPPRRQRDGGGDAQRGPEIPMDVDSTSSEIAQAMMIQLLASVFHLVDARAASRELCEMSF